MKYIIHELVQPSHLKEIKEDGYYNKTVYRQVLERLDISGVEEVHDSIELAYAEIVSKKELLKHLKLTIIPIISIGWDLEITD